MKRKSALDVFFWACLFLVVSQALAFFLASREKVFFEEKRIVSPDLSLGVPVLYFFTVAILLGIILFFIPVSKLRLVLRVLFGFLYSWSIFIAVALSAPWPVALLISVPLGITWFIRPTIWLHNLLMVFTMSASGSTLGFLFSPWTFLIFMLIIAVYDILAVRFGYMLWMAGKLSESDTLPAFIIPRQLSHWTHSLRESRLERTGEAKETGRDFSILGGGDIAFPIMLTVSVFFSAGAAGALIVAGFSIIGLAGAYGIQRFFLKGKPMPAIPPIAVACLIGLLLVRFV